MSKKRRLNWGSKDLVKKGETSYRLNIIERFLKGRVENEIEKFKALI